MGLFDVISGITVGDIFQAVSGIFGQAYKHTDGTTFSSTIDSGGVTFFLQTDANGRAQLFAGNPSTEIGVSAVVPNDDLTGLVGATYLIGPQSASLVSEAATAPPRMLITTGNINTPGDNPTALFKLAFKGLRLGGGAVSIGNFQLSCTTGQLTIVSGGIALTAISYMFFKSNRGNTVTSSQVIPANPTNDGSTYTFPVNFGSYGFGDLDVMDCWLTLDSGGTTADMDTLCKKTSKPFTAAQKAYFKFLAEQSNLPARKAESMMNV